MGHRNARLTVHGRRLLVERVRFEGMPVAHVAKAMGISRQCAHRWVARFDAEGDAGLEDRSSRPHCSPTRTSAEIERRVAGARLELRVGPDRLHAVILRQKDRWADDSLSRSAACGGPCPLTHDRRDRIDDEIERIDVLAAVFTDRSRVHDVPARLVDESDGVAVFGLPLVAPRQECGQDGYEVPALLGEPILVTWWMLLVLLSSHDPGVDQCGQTRRQDVPCDTKTCLEVVETPKTVEGISDDENRPPLADVVEGPCDGAVLVCVLFWCHDQIVNKLVAFCNGLWDSE